ncbi:hypothetical protein ACFE04_008124 [Oxalis oulophora]
METSNDEIVDQSFNEIRDEITKLRQELAKYLEVWGNSRVVVEDSARKDSDDEIDILEIHNSQRTFDEDSEVVITQCEIKTILISNHFSGDNQKQENKHATQKLQIGNYPFHFDFLVFDYSCFVNGGVAWEDLISPLECDNMHQGVYHLFDPGIDFDGVRFKKDRPKILSYGFVRDDNGIVNQRDINSGFEEACGRWTKFLNDKVTKVVVTMPAYFNVSQRTTTKYVGRVADLEVLHIINEPIVASLTYGFDFSLSGEDFDEVVFNYFAEKMKEEYKTDVVSNTRACLMLRTGCENLKKIDITSRMMLLDVISAIDRCDYLGRFVQLKGLLILYEWLQKVHKGKTGYPKEEGDKSTEEFLFVLLCALDKLLVYLHALQTCRVGKSVNNLPEMNMSDTKTSNGQVVSWSTKPAPSEVSHNGEIPKSENASPTGPFSHLAYEICVGHDKKLRHMVELSQALLVNGGLIAKQDASLQAKNESNCPHKPNVKGCHDIYASFDKYVEDERLEWDSKYHAERHGMQDAKQDMMFISVSYTPQMEPVLGRNMSTGFDPSTFRSVYISYDYTEVVADKLKQMGIIRSIVKRLKDVDLGFKEACQSTIGSLAGKYLRKKSDGDVFGLFVKLL